MSIIFCNSDKILSSDFLLLGAGQKMTILFSASKKLFSSFYFERSFKILRPRKKYRASTRVVLGSPHVLWQVSFGFWVTWPISSWQENYKSVFFPKLQFLNDKLQLYPKMLFGTLAKLFWSIYHSKVSKLKK